MPSDAIRGNQRPSAHLLEAFGDEFRAGEVDHLMREAISLMREAIRLMRRVPCERGRPP
jgi:hypothetical protein